MAHIGVNSNDTGDKCQVCVRKGHLLRDINIVETGYEGGGKRREPWQRQTALGRGLGKGDKAVVKDHVATAFSPYYFHF